MANTFSVGWYDREIDDWYYEGEYEHKFLAIESAERVARRERSTSRITDFNSGETELFHPTDDDQDDETEAVRQLGRMTSRRHVDAI